MADSIWLDVPSNLVYCVKITDLAGMLSPIAKVEVAKTSFSRPSVKRISTIAFKSGIMPAWWNPMPR